MRSVLTNKDYISILRYYKINIPKSKQILKEKAEQIMADKLCKCIKTIDMNNEPKSIGICTKSIFNNKGFTRGKFKCKSKRVVAFRKTIKRKPNKNNKK